MNKIGKIQLSRFQIGLDEKLHTNFLCKCKTLNNISYSCFPLQHLLNMHLVATNPKFHFPFSARVDFSYPPEIHVCSVCCHHVSHFSLMQAYHCHCFPLPHDSSPTAMLRLYSTNDSCLNVCCENSCVENGYNLPGVIGNAKPSLDIV